MLSSLDFRAGTSIVKGSFNRFWAKLLHPCFHGGFSGNHNRFGENLDFTHSGFTVMDFGEFFLYSGRKFGNPKE
ncbi:hypothetical protein V6N13_066957 [Hibiscus sabdariffa]|uniref:Uncharacterized protein n=1 Tax=Hibiscus sabdariffa TaxID=183260 RepID=A0ABR2DRZ7_9ROSI